MARNTIARIDVPALAHNLARVRELAPRSRVMAVVKADAYGHRLDLCLPALAGADLLAVATLEEARAIRRLGSRQPVLLLEGVIEDADLSVAAELGLELTVHHDYQVAALERFGTSPTPRLWLKLDSGMHRLGFQPEDVPSVHARLMRLPGVHQVNLVSHFASADRVEHPQTKRQYERFQSYTQGLDGEICLANSAAVLNFPATHGDWVRAGIMLYGISPVGDRDGPKLGLKPVMTLTSELMAINRVPAGEAIGYGGRYVAERDLRVGVAAIGYGDGYPRSTADGTPVRVAGQDCALAGRVSMDMITIDLANCPQARVGDRVVLWGRDLPIETVAERAGTIPYELVCRITRRVRYRADE
ncbi:MAG: alanine racemase [Gammaproteobacteria bacterium]|jgi:alanine racemase|nr:alanine racemase [Gammaproteobacteria bacterium]